MKVYVAGASSEMERISSAIAQLRSAGIEIVCTWPEVVAATPGGANPADASREDRAAWSRQDLLEVQSADVLLFLVPLPPATTRGAWWEAGVAYAHDKHIVSSGSTLQSVFCALGAEFHQDALAIGHVIALHQRTQTQPVTLFEFEQIDDRFDDGGCP